MTAASLTTEQDLVIELIKSAKEDPRLHRRLELRPGMAKPLKPWQAVLVELVESKIRLADGSWLTIRICRQAGKNEIAATVHERFLLFHCHNTSNIVRTAPNWKPQIVNSKQRLIRLAANDPLFDDHQLRWVEGFCATYGKASVTFLSAHPDAKVEGATADALLDIDEAHLTDEASYQEKLAPMTASTNACKVLYGVAGMRLDLLYAMRERNFELGRYNDNIEISATVLCEHDEAYRAHYESRVAELGPTHPVIRTQYDLVDQDALGGAFTPEHQLSFFAGQHGRLGKPQRRGVVKYVAVIDLAGEEEVEQDMAEDVGFRESPDCAVFMVAEIDPSKARGGKSAIRIVAAYRWQGLKIQRANPSEGPSLQEELMAAMGMWQPAMTVIDARGVGIGTASWLARMWSGAVDQYSASSSSVTEDLYGLWAYLNLGQIKMWANDESQEWRQLKREMSWARAVYGGNEDAVARMVNIKKPSPNRKIDMVKCLSYLPRAAAGIDATAVWSFKQGF